MKLKELTKAEFKKFTAKCEVDDFLQSLEMFERYQTIEKEAYLLGVEQDGRLLAAALLVAKRTRFGKIFNAPRGFLMDYEATNSRQVFKFFTQSLQRYLREKQGIMLQISPKISHIVETDRQGNLQEKTWQEGKWWRDFLRSLKYKELGEFEQVKWIYSLDLVEFEPERAVKRLRSGHKWSIRYARERYGVKIRKLDYDELEKFKKLVEEAGEKHIFQDPSLNYYQEMYKAFGKKVEFLVAERENQVLAGAMFILYGNEVTYLFSGMRGELKKYGGAHLLQWQMIQEAKKQSFKKYNFYSTRPEPGNGVYEFKRGFRGEVEEMLGTFVLPVNFKGWLYTKKMRYQKFGKIK